MINAVTTYRTARQPVQRPISFSLFPKKKKKLQINQSSTLNLPRFQLRNGLFLLSRYRIANQIYYNGSTYRANNTYSIFVIEKDSIFKVFPPHRGQTFP